MAVVAEHLSREPVGKDAEVVFAVCRAALDLPNEEKCVVVSAEEIPGVQVAFPPCFLGALDKLPVVEPRAEAAGDRLRVPGALVMAEALVGEAQGLGEHPAFAVVLGEEGIDALLAVATGISNLRIEVARGDRGSRRCGGVRVPNPCRYARIPLGSADGSDEYLQSFDGVDRIDSVHD